MYANFTDAENTGAPMVPLIETDETADVIADGGFADDDYRETILSHRLEE
jgi:hypothetical protein